MTKMTKKVALSTAIDALSANTEMTEVCTILRGMIEQLDAKASKSTAYANKQKAKESADRAELGHILANAIADAPQTLTELIKTAGLEISTQKAVRCLAEIGIKGERVKGKVVYVATAYEESEGE